MATAELTFHVTTDTRKAMRVLRLLRPLVFMGLLSTDRAMSIVMRFVRIDLRRTF